MSYRVYFMPCYGLGNIVQTTPAVAWLERHGEVVLVEHPTTSQFIRAVYGSRYRVVAQAPKAERLFKSVNPSTFVQGGSISEVQANLHKVGCTDMSSVSLTGYCDAPDDGEQFDLVLANGFNRTKSLTEWEAKAYPHWGKVVRLLPTGLKVATVGLPGEHVPGTIDRTGIGLSQTLTLVKQARFFASNDTGLYHAAAAMKVPGLVLFTFTDTTKNHDPVFHASIEVVCKDLDCRPCQLKGRGYWNQQRPRCGWVCQDIQPELVAEKIRKALC